MVNIISPWDIQWFRGGAFRSELWASVSGIDSVVSELKYYNIELEID